MIEQVGLTLTDVRVFHRAMNGHGIDFHPLAIFPILAALGDFADVDLRIEVGGKCLAMITGVAIDDVQIMDFIEIVFGGVCGVDACHTGVETATEQGHDASFFETILIGPLPAVLEFGFVARLVVGGVHIVGFSGQTGVHQRKVLIRERHIDQQVRFVAVEQLDGFLHIVGIHLGGLDAVASNFSGNLVAFGFGAGGEHDFGEHFRHGSAFVCHHGSHAAGTDDKNFCHSIAFLVISVSRVQI